MYEMRRAKYILTILTRVRQGLTDAKAKRIMYEALVASHNAITIEAHFR